MSFKVCLILPYLFGYNENKLGESKNWTNLLTSLSQNVLTGNMDVCF